MIKGTGRYESASRVFGATEIRISGKDLTEAGRVNSRGQGVCREANILVITRVFALGAKGAAITRAMFAIVVMGLGAGVSITDINGKEKSMKHRHIHAKKGEWIHIHRDNNSGCLGVVIVIAIIVLLMHGC